MGDVVCLADSVLRRFVLVKGVRCLVVCELFFVVSYQGWCALRFVLSLLVRGTRWGGISVSVLLALSRADVLLMGLKGACGCLLFRSFGVGFFAQLCGRMQL